ncbi:MAG TPA: cupredoxin domain-containing protein [Solirubrobacteraceae bacterium]|nr:cupredoxin domain-containing protein [Solirubrobacteraceae bacterium]
MDYADTNIQFGRTQARQPRHTLSKITIVAMSAVAVVLALVGLDVALIGGTQQPPPHPVMQVVKVTGAPQVQPVVYLTVSPELKPGADGKLHDAFSVTNFDVHAGQPVKLVINNTDSTAHSINSPVAGVNIVVAPGTHTYTLIVHKKGSFEWQCMMPCDPYSMAHMGYMRGYITST